VFRDRTFAYDVAKTNLAEILKRRGIENAHSQSEGVMVERHEPVGEIVLYQTPDGHARVECRFAGETLWLSQALIAELFQTTPRTLPSI
jgi:hypothetical protein